MNWIFGILIVGFIIYRFLVDMKKDEKVLNEIKLDLHFKDLVEALNQNAFNSKGEITIIDKREFNLYQDGQNKIINFLYNSGILIITWKYKYLQKEVVLKKRYINAININNHDQIKIAENIINEMSIIIDNHQKQINSNF